ncbi:ArsR family transcriptional regulator [Sphingobacterium sp. SGG-5]|uniref:ArsR family transcriptional regulator n=1 Tax=Sphingobacterium sp. SGG-5 TaxID=2710881 RepID=UPI0013EA60FE|nr:ArsR family transcriptional regulator [Sphingobacterium sp. SGG-5]NGM63437.1 ArsR family transcriptional regulator [Sphingobacterium sp. SGG-5]
MLNALITSKTRLKLLIKFFVSASNSGYLRGIAGEFNESTNAIRKELNQLTDAGYLLREQNDQKIIYRANTAHTLFSSLQGLIHHFLGIDKFVDRVFERAGDVEEVALLGDYAKGIDSGHLEVLVMGEKLDKDYLEEVAEKAAKLIKKKITVYTWKPDEQQAKIVLFKREE